MTSIFFKGVCSTTNQISWNSWRLGFPQTKPSNNSSACFRWGWWRLSFGRLWWSASYLDIHGLGWNPTVILEKRGKMETFFFSLLQQRKINLWIIYWLHPSESRWRNSQKGGLVRGHDRPIHGSCAIYFPGGIVQLSHILEVYWKENR